MNKALVIHQPNFLPRLKTVFRQAWVNIIYYDYSQISYTDSCSLDYYRNNSFLDFVAYNGPELLRKLIIVVKQRQIERFK